MAKGQKRTAKEPKKAGDASGRKEKKLAGPKYMQSSMTSPPEIINGAIRRKK